MTKSLSCRFCEAPVEAPTHFPATLLDHTWFTDEQGRQHDHDDANRICGTAQCKNGHTFEWREPGRCHVPGCGWKSGEPELRQAIRYPLVLHERDILLVRDGWCGPFATIVLPAGVLLRRGDSVLINDSEWEVRVVDAKQRASVEFKHLLP